MNPYSIAKAHPFHDFTDRIIGREVSVAHTVCFLGEVDLGDIEAIRAGGARFCYTAFVVKAVALALKRFPYANRRMITSWIPFRRSRMQEFASRDVAVAVERDLPETAVASFLDVMRNSELESLAVIDQRLRALSHCDESNNKQWRQFSSGVRRLPPWLSSSLASLPRIFPSLWTKWRGGAALISSPSKYGVDTVIGAWMAPLGISFGLARQKAVVRDDRVQARPTFTLTLNFDRRVMAGAQAARFFKGIIDILEQAHTSMREFLPSAGAEKLTTRTAELAMSSA